MRLCLILGKIEDWLSFLGLPAEESGHIQVVGGNVVADVTNVLLNLVHHIRERLLLGQRLFHFATGFPGLGQEGRLLLNGLLVGLLEARGDHRDFHGIFHRIIHDRAKNDVGVLMRGLLNDRGCFVNLVKSET